MAGRPEKSTSAGREDSLGAATRMLAEATSALTAAIKQEASGVVPEVRVVLASGLRDAARGLSDASASVEGSGARRARARRQAKADHTRSELLAGAAQVFEDKGYEGASVGDIASAAGFTKGAVYANFPSKADVFLDLAKNVLTAQGEQPCVPGLVEMAPGPEREAAIADWLRDSEGQPGMLLALEFISYALRHPESGDALRPYYESAFEALARQVAYARRVSWSDMPPAPEGTQPADLGEIEPDDDDWACALVVLSLSNIVPLFSTFIGSDRMTAEAAARIIERMLAE